jgi:hypothetical protein
MGLPNAPDGGRERGPPRRFLLRDLCGGPRMLGRQLTAQEKLWQLPTPAMI